MKKLLLLCLFLMPALSYGQLSVSAIGGDNGYASLKAEFKYNVTPSFYITPKYSFYQDNDTVDMVSRYGLRLGWLPAYRWDLGVEGSWVPAVNGYSSYVAGADGKFYLLKGERTTVSSLYIGLGADYINHKQDPGFFTDRNDALSPFDIDELRGKIMAGADVWILLIRAQFEKALRFSDTPTGNEVIWEQEPFFTSVDKQFLDYVLGGSVVLPTEYINFYGAYSTYKYKTTNENSQSLNAGATVKLPGGLGITGNVEFRDFDKSSSRIYYSLSSSIAL